MEEGRRVRRAKKWNRLILGMILAALLMGLGIFRESRRFTAEKWLKAPDDRTKIVADLLDRHRLVGRTRQEIVALLGEEEAYADSKTSFKISNTYFDPEDTLVYYLGVDYMDDRWLILSLKSGVVTDCRIDVT